MFNFDRPIVNQFPTGRWGFVGRVPVTLGYVQQNGETPTAKQCASAAHCGPGIAGLRPRTWETKEEAEQALADHLAALYAERPLSL